MEPPSQRLRAAAGLRPCRWRAYGPGFRCDLGLRGRHVSPNVPSGAQSTVALLRPQEAPRLQVPGHCHPGRPRLLACRTGASSRQRLEDPRAIRSRRAHATGESRPYNFPPLSLLANVYLQIYDGRRVLYVYGDPAYHGSFGVLCPFPSTGITREQHGANVAMSRARIAVENAFGYTANLWRTNQFAMQLQAGNQPVAAFYMVSILLTNIYTCVQQHATPFGLRPPLLDEYLAPAFRQRTAGPGDASASPSRSRSRSSSSERSADRSLDSAL